MTRRPARRWVARREKRRAKRMLRWPRPKKSPMQQFREFMSDTSISAFQSPSNMGSTREQRDRAMMQYLLGIRSTP